MGERAVDGAGDEAAVRIVRIGAGATVGERKQGEGVPKDIAMIGRSATVAPGATVPADGEIPPVSS